ncbi:MAG: carbon-nitrogen family hydrolase [Deltaproteobacteria bacterium]|nr:carbon-nitrogen family hydrolase [Deltaproteobacteria bacterium]
MIPPFSAAVLQFRIDMGDVEANAARAFRLLAKAAGRGSRLCVLPEMWSTGFFYDDLPGIALTTPALLARLRAFAAERRIVIAGSLPERAGRSVFNTLTVIDETGRIAGTYRKTHLFTPSGEHLHFRRGTAAGAAKTAVGRVGPLICYDLRFPELARKYFLERVTILCVSAQWPTVRKAHWELLAAARAVENQLYVAASNATGPSGPFRYSGGSAIVSPMGDILASAGEEEGIATAVIDPSQVEDARRRIPCAKDRNERAYRMTRPGR